MYLHIHKQDIVALFCTLDQLGTELGYKSGVPEARSMQSRIIAVLQRVSDEGWSVIRPELDDVCVPEGGASKLEEEVERLRVENARMRDELGKVEEMKKELARLEDENAGLRASNARYHDFCVDTRQHARSQHAELLTVSNKFYTFSSQWGDAEREMTEFLAREEKLVNP